MSKIRADHVNEAYYAKRTAPPSNQFVGRVQLLDEKGRQYIIVEKNTHVYPNERLQFKPLDGKRPRECITNTHGYVKLYVRLPDTHTIRWFTHREMNKPLVLHMAADPSITYTVTLKSTDKPDPRSATGAIFVKEATYGAFRTLLNELHQEGRKK